MKDKLTHEKFDEMVLVAIQGDPNVPTQSQIDMSKEPKQWLETFLAKQPESNNGNKQQL